MITFVHLVPEKEVKSILRSGIKTSEVYGKEIKNGVFCMPLTQDYFATYQWLRELKRKGQNKFLAIHFKVPDNEEVLFGHYGNREDNKKVTASEAVKLMMESENKQGIEIIINRKIDKKEIVKTVHINNNVGWRYYPGSHARKLCKCTGCISTRDFKGKQLLKKEYFKYIHLLSVSTDSKTIISNLCGIREYICTNKKSYSKLEHFTPFLQHVDAKVREYAIEIVHRSFDHFNSTNQMIHNMLQDKDANVRYKAAETLINYEKENYPKYYEMFKNDVEVKAKLEELFKTYLDYEDEEDDNF
jgi:hypothetical protein